MKRTALSCFTLLCLSTLILVPSCSDDPTGGGETEGYCVNTVGDACTGDEDCPLATRCVSQGFCAAVCTSNDQCDGARCYGGSGGGNNGENNGENNGGENQPPTANDDSALTPINQFVEVDVVANDEDPDGDDLEVSEFTQGENGEVASGSKGKLDYTPNPEFQGSDSFTYTISDGRGGTDTATVNVLVSPHPTLVITSPMEGDEITGDRVTINFEVTNCDFGSPGNSDNGCHLHKFVDGEAWRDENDENNGHFDTSAFELYPLTPGEHTLRIVLVKNDGTDEDWVPEIDDEIVITVVEEVEPECTDDAGCTDTQICSEEGVCIAGCRDDAGCTDGQVCRDMVCLSLIHI